MKFDPFAPFTQWTRTWDVWQKMAEDSLSRTTSFYDEMDRLEAKGVERAETAIHELAKMTKETLAYNAQLGAEWRKLSLEALQKASSAFVEAASNETSTTSAR